MLKDIPVPGPISGKAMLVLGRDVLGIYQADISLGQHLQQPAAPTHGISAAMVYNIVDGKVAKVKGSGGLTPKDGNYTMEAICAESW